MNRRSFFKRTVGALLAAPLMRMLPKAVMPQQRRAGFPDMARIDQINRKYWAGIPITENNNIGGLAFYVKEGYFTEKEAANV